jgi:hypothetical protein
LPNFLLGRSIISDIVRVNQIDKDWGPGTKILGPLKLLPDESYVVIADDDIIYDRRFLSGLIARQVKDHSSSFSYYVYRAYGLSIGQGCDGLSVWSPNLNGMLEFVEQYVDGTSLIYHDDIWINFYLATKGVTARKVPLPDAGKLIYKQVLSNDVLASLEGDTKRSKILQDHLPRLLRSGVLPPHVRGALRRRALQDDLISIWRRGMNKLTTLNARTRSE